MFLLLTKAPGKCFVNLGSFTELLLFCVYRTSLRMLGNCFKRFCVISAAPQSMLLLAVCIVTTVFCNIVQTSLRSFADVLTGYTSICIQFFNFILNKLVENISDWRRKLLITFRKLTACILIRSKKKQQYAGTYLLQNHSTCFGCPSHPSSGVHKTNCSLWYWSYCQSNNLPPAWPN